MHHKGARPRADGGGTGRPVTIGEVARGAGVSVATVSRALRGLPNVAPSTRERVRAVATKLDYHPDRSAARLASGRSRTIAMAVPNLDSWYFGQVMAAAHAVLVEDGYDLLLCAVANDQEGRRDTLGPLVTWVDGLILVNLRLEDDETGWLLQAKPAVVTVGASTPGFSSVRVDDVRVAELAVEHLVGLGHRRIGMLTDLTEPEQFEVPLQRRDGYRRALRTSGIEVDDVLEQEGGFSAEGGFEAMNALLDLDDPPTAIFSMSDEMAFGALRAAWQRGLTVPDDLSIVGVDDHDFSAVVGLTTIQQDVAGHGTLAADLLLDLLAPSDDAGPREETVPVSLVERTTTCSLDPARTSAR